VHHERLMLYLFDHDTAGMEVARWVVAPEQGALYGVTQGDINKWLAAVLDWIKAHPAQPMESPAAEGA